MAAPTVEQLRADAMRAYDFYEQVRDDPNSSEKQQKKALREYGYRKMIYDRAVGGSDSDSEYEPDAAVVGGGGGGDDGGDDGGGAMYRAE